MEPVCSGGKSREKQPLIRMENKMNAEQIAREAQEEIRTCNWFSEDTCWASDGPTADMVAGIIEKTLRAANTALTETVARLEKQFQQDGNRISHLQMQLTQSKARCETLEQKVKRQRLELDRLNLDKLEAKRKAALQPPTVSGTEQEGEVRG